MAQSIIPVTGTAHSASTFDDIFEALALKGDAATQGVVKGKLNELATTGATSPIATNTGWAFVNGKLYKNTASVNTVVASPAVSTRIDRLVVRVDYTASPETGTLTLIAGVEGGAAPAVTQVDGTTWDLPLYQVSITTGGVITLTSERAYCGQRTRILAVPCTEAWNLAPAEIDRTNASPYGMPMVDGQSVQCFGSFYVPSDYVSGGVVIPVVYAGGTGNLRGDQTLYYGATGETPGSVATAAATQAVTNTQLTNLTTIQTAMTGVAAGDHVMIVFQRTGAHGDDTVGATVQFVQWLVSYTADS